MRHVHFIGIGGYSMSGLASALRARGLTVSGSDSRPSERTERLKALGIPVYYGHDPLHLAGADTVVYNTDVPVDNPERAAAARQGLDLLHRSEVLAWLLAEKRALCVTGTHGKTTTASMAGLALKAGGLDPLIMVGGEVQDLGGTNAYLGAGEWVVAEADESDGSFLRYHPEIAVITNVEPEHLEHYDGKFENVITAFRTFIMGMAPPGTAVVNADDPVLTAITAALADPHPALITFGFAPTADWRATDVTTDALGSQFTITFRGQPMGVVQLPVPGRHNLYNALGAVAAAHRVGVPLEPVLQQLTRFQGAKRRFQVLSRRHGILVVDDYAHNPTKVRAALDACRQVTYGRILAVFQPQRYSRTEFLWHQFVEVLGDLRAEDVLFVTDIYAPPGEEPRPQVTAARLVKEACERHPGQDVRYASDLRALTSWLEDHARPGDTVVTIGAGDIWRVAHALADRMAGVRSTV